VAGVVGEGVQGGAGVAAGCPAEADGAGLAGGAGDWGGAALGDGVLGAAGPVQDGADLGDDLAEVDLADVGRGRQELGLGMAQECRADGTVEIGDRRQQGG
jgi:hypothetical protein